MGPGAVIVSRQDKIEWRPDAYEVRDAEQPLCWRAAEVRCRSEQRRRDSSSGIGYAEFVLVVPQGEVTLGPFNEVRHQPSFLRAM